MAAESPDAGSGRWSPTCDHGRVPDNPGRRRRKVRRTSPDAPQGLVPVAVVLGSLALVIVFTAAALGPLGTSGAKQSDAEQVTAGKVAEKGGTTTSEPTSTIITASTALFVTTTRPIVTTTTVSTTTTTTKPAKDLSARPSGVAFEVGAATTTFTVRTSGKRPVVYFITGLPAGVSASPSSGKVTKAKPSTVTLARNDPNAEVSGVFRVIGSDGSNVRVGLSGPGRTLRIANVATSPSPAPCGAPVQLTVTIANGTASSVKAQFDSGGTTALTSVDDTTWSTTIPAQSSAGSVNGEVVVTGSSGSTVTSRFSYKVGSGNGATC